MVLTELNKKPKMKKDVNVLRIIRINTEPLKQLNMIITGTYINFIATVVIVVQ